MFDGRFVFLFLNGEQVGQVFAEGSISDVDLPIRIGGTTQTQHFDGVIDNVFISTNPVTRAPTSRTSPASVGLLHAWQSSPDTSGPVPPGTTVPYDVGGDQHDVGACGLAKLCAAEPLHAERFHDVGQPVLHRRTEGPDRDTSSSP